MGTVKWAVDNSTHRYRVCTAIGPKKPLGFRMTRFVGGAGLAQYAEKVVTKTIGGAELLAGPLKGATWLAIAAHMCLLFDHISGDISFSFYCVHQSDKCQQWCREYYEPVDLQYLVKCCFLVNIMFLAFVKSISNFIYRNAAKEKSETLVGATSKHWKAEGNRPTCFLVKRAILRLTVALVSLFIYWAEYYLVTQLILNMTNGTEKYKYKGQFMCPQPLDHHHNPKGRADLKTEIRTWYQDYKDETTKDGAINAYLDNPWFKLQQAVSHSVGGGDGSWKCEGEVSCYRTRVVEENIRLLITYAVITLSIIGIVVGMVLEIYVTIMKLLCDDRENYIKKVRFWEALETVPMKKTGYEPIKPANHVISVPREESTSMSDIDDASMHTDNELKRTTTARAVVSGFPERTRASQHGSMAPHPPRDAIMNEGNPLTQNGSFHALSPTSGPAPNTVYQEQGTLPVNRLRTQSRNSNMSSTLQDPRIEVR